MPASEISATTLPSSSAAMMLRAASSLVVVMAGEQRGGDAELVRNGRETRVSSQAMRSAPRSCRARAG